MSFEFNSPQIYAGIPIRGETPSGRLGTLGAILSRLHDGALFGITAAHVVLDEAFAPDGTNVGRRHALQLQPKEISKEYTPIDEAIAFVQLDENIIVTGGALPTTASGNIAEPIAVIGQPVMRCSIQTTAMTTAKLTGLECPLHLRSVTTQSITTYSGALEITSESTRVPFALGGDSGAAVVTADGDLLGILLGSSGARFFAAPLYPLLREHGFGLASPETIFSHNSIAAQCQANNMALHQIKGTAVANWTVLHEFRDTVTSESVHYARSIADVA